MASDTNIAIEAGDTLLRIDAVYRFFELFDLKNIPKAEPIAYFAHKRADNPCR